MNIFQFNQRIHIKKILNKKIMNVQNKLISFLFYFLFTFKSGNSIFIKILSLISTLKYKKVLNLYEMVLIAVCTENIYSKIELKSLFLSTHLILPLQKNNTIKILIDSRLFYNFNSIIAILYYLKAIIENIIIFAFLIFVTFTCLVLQIILCNKIGTNTKRKLFHFAILIVFFKRSKFVIHSAQILLFLFYIFQEISIFHPFLLHFKSERDSVDKIYSHIFLLASILYSAIMIKSEIAYFCSLTAVCVLDSTASLYGKFRGYNKKSKDGALFGFVCACLFYYCFYQDFRCFKTFLILSWTEYFVPINDNILLPFVVFMLEKYNLIK